MGECFIATVAKWHNFGKGTSYLISMLISVHPYVKQGSTEPFAAIGAKTTFGR